MFKNILVAVDGSVHANRAIEYGATLARQFGAKLTLLHVMPRAGSHQVPDDLRHFARIEHVPSTEADILGSVADAIVVQAKDLAQSCGAQSIQTAIETGDATTNIIKYSTSHDIDTIVMGRRGLGDLAGLLLGSVSHKVAQQTKCACLTVGQN